MNVKQINRTYVYRNNFLMCINHAPATAVLRNSCE